MGNDTDDFRVPKKEKMYFDKSNSYIKIGACEMQGWRKTMEDAAIVLLDYQKDASLFGILDGHGGAVVSKFVANNLKAILVRTEAYRKGEYEKALFEAYILMDSILSDPEIIEFLYNIEKEKKELTIKSAQFDNIPKEKKNEVINVKLRYDKNWIEYPLRKIDNSVVNHKKDTKIYVSLFTEKDLLNKCNVSAGETGVNASTSDSIHAKEEILDKREEEFNENFDQSNYEILFEESKEEIELSTKKSKSFKEIPHNVAKIVNEMGTTANVLLIKGHSLFLANIGDSQSVMFKNGKAITLSREHKTYLKSEQERIIKSGSIIKNNRIDGILNLTRALGDFYFKSKQDLSNIEQSVIPLPEITKISDEGIDFIVMGCDGVWDCVDDKQAFMKQIDEKIKENPEGKLSEIIGQIFDKHLSPVNGVPIGTDNMSCIIVQFIKGSS